MNLYNILNGFVSDKGRNVFMNIYYRDGYGAMSPNGFQELCRSINQNEKGSLRVVAKEGGVYLSKKEETALTGACLQIILGKMGLDKETINRKREEINSPQQEWFYFTKSITEKTALDDQLAELESSALYEEAAKILLEEGEVERAKLYEAASALAQQIPIPWYAD